MEYRTVEKNGEYSVTINRSQFIGYVSPAPDEETAVAFIEQIRRKHSDARHNVYAYVIDKNRKRYSDDAEPQGTAGLPVLGVIESNKLQNTVIVVTRYFGGVLLGTGGLVRAYTEAASGAVTSGGIILMTEAQRLSLCCSYTDYNGINFILNRHGSRVINSDFSEIVFLEFETETDKIDALCRDITEATGGRVDVKASDGIIFMKKSV